MTIQEFYNKLIVINFDKLKEDAVLANKDVIVKLNQSQMHLGRTSLDQNIEPYYSDLYLKRKMKMPSYVAPPSVPDLYLTGEFYGEMDVIVDNGQYFITSFDSKNRFLSERYVDIFGLSKENIEEAKIPVTNTFLELIKKELFGL